MRIALEDAGLGPQDIDYICANANSTQKADLIETEAIKDVFSDRAKKIPVSSIKSMTGECFSASGALQAVASVGALAKGFVPPTINYEVPDPDCDLDYVANRSRPKTLNNILINSFGPGGNNSCLIIGRFKG
jgi:3-oxoacyl-[acyl-carrier-protein] synthase II